MENFIAIMSEDKYITNIGLTEFEVAKRRLLGVDDRVIIRDIDNIENDLKYVKNREVIVAPTSKALASLVKHNRKFGEAVVVLMTKNTKFNVFMDHKSRTCFYDGIRNDNDITDKDIESIISEIEGSSKHCRYNDETCRLWSKYIYSLLCHVKEEEVFEGRIIISTKSMHHIMYKITEVTLDYSIILGECKEYNGSDMNETSINISNRIRLKGIGWQDQFYSEDRTIIELNKIYEICKGSGNILEKVDGDHIIIAGDNREGLIVAAKEICNKYGLAIVE